MKLACWNINSVRARHERLIDWLTRTMPDVLCLQETKVVDQQFPSAEIEKLGYQWAHHGQKTYNGVAILARTPLTDVRRGLDDGVEDTQARLLDARVGGCRVISCYVPNGGEITNEKYVYKLAWLARLKNYLARTCRPDEPLIVCGDFNVAPRTSDAAHPEAWEQTVLCHPDVRAALNEVCAWGLQDVFAAQHPAGGVYSWWDYRMLAFPRDDGLRIDLILATESVARTCTRTWVDREARKGKQPSDHAPVLAEFTLG